MKCFEMIKAATVKADFIINRKHEMFWNRRSNKRESWNSALTVNMKCFEIMGWQQELDMMPILTVNMKCFEITSKCYSFLFLLINRKHEMFWNKKAVYKQLISEYINRKHEMFWN